MRANKKIKKMNSVNLISSKMMMRRFTLYRKKFRKAQTMKYRSKNLIKKRFIKIF